MKRWVASAAVALAALLPAASSAAVFTADFTDSSQFSTGDLVGTFGGVVFTLSSPSGVVNFNDSIGDPTAVYCGTLIACGNDGAGIDDDEISYGINVSEVLYVTTSKAIRITDVYLLDLFFDPRPGATSQETALVDIGDDGTDFTIPAAEPRFAFNNGFRAEPLIGAPWASLFAFRTADTNDDAGVPDYALAGLVFEVEMAPIPLPATLPLLGGAAMALALATRRKRR